MFARLCLRRSIAALTSRPKPMLVLSGDFAVGRPIMTAPDVPPEKVRALRRAFDDTLMDPLFIDAANKAHMDFHPVGVEELQSIVSRIAGASPNAIAMVKQAITIKDVRPLPASQNAKDGAAGDKE